VRDEAVATEARVVVETDRDIVSARQQGRVMAVQLGFSPGSATLIATAISELSRNILLYASRGEVTMRTIENNGSKGITVEARDDGPGIPQPQRALEDGFSTSGRLGLGLPGVKRLMDEFRLETAPGRGTVIVVHKWVR
jgi:serine/threonine-protein kinase RsbT